MRNYFTVGQLAKHGGVSRTTLLHYERIGLLVPSARSDAGYRFYTDADMARLLQVREYRATGMALESIAALLDSHDRDGVIEQRLQAIGREMAILYEQQAVLLRLLDHSDTGPQAMDKQRWTNLLSAAGMDDATMNRWHAMFEQQAPIAHANFLRSLGLDRKEIARIRKWSMELAELL
jgi:DNA-binding transcriptional MerR regulator